MKFDMQVTLDRRPHFWRDVAYAIASEVGQEPEDMRIFPPLAEAGRGKPARVVVWFKSIPMFERSDIEQLVRDYGVEATDIEIADYGIMDPRREEG